LTESRVSFQSEEQSESRHFLRGGDYGETQATETVLLLESLTRDLAADWL
jgi:hypothetical protein